MCCSRLSRCRRAEHAALIRPSPLTALSRRRQQPRGNTRVRQTRRWDVCREDWASERAFVVSYAFAIHSKTDDQHRRTRTHIVTGK